MQDQSFTTTMCKKHELNGILIVMCHDIPWYLCMLKISNRLSRLSFYLITMQLGHLKYCLAVGDCELDSCTFFTPGEYGLSCKGSSI